MSNKLPLSPALLCAFVIVVSACLAALAQPEDTPADEPRPAGESAEPAAAQPDATSDEQVEQIIEDLERAATQDRIANPPPADPDLARAGRLLREGSFLRLRRGRVVRNERGEWEFRMDVGVDAASPEPPMVLLECQNLMTIEAIAERHGDAITFTMSGEVFVYKDRNFLLPRYYVVNRVTNEMLPTQ